MRHLHSSKKFNRNSSHRRAMFRSLVTNLVVHDKIETTEAKAKALRSHVERLIATVVRFEAKARETASGEQKKYYTNPQIAKQFLQSQLFDTSSLDDGKFNILEKTFGSFFERYKDRKGGYTRIIKLGPRRGDGAPVVAIELVLCFFRYLWALVAQPEEQEISNLPVAGSNPAKRANKKALRHNRKAFF